MRDKFALSGALFFGCVVLLASGDPNGSTSPQSPITAATAPSSSTSLPSSSASKTSAHTTRAVNGVLSTEPVVATTTTKPTTQKHDVKKAQKKSDTTAKMTETVTTKKATTKPKPSALKTTKAAKSTTTTAFDVTQPSTPATTLATVNEITATTTAVPSTTTATTTTTTTTVPETIATWSEQTANATTTPTLVLVDDDDDDSADMTTTTTTGVDESAHFPHFIHHAQLGTKVRLCTCNETDECARIAFIHLDACKRQCIITLEEYYREVPDELMECFPDMDDELLALDGCIRSNVNNMCSKDGNSIVYIDPPYAAGAPAENSDLFSYFAFKDPLEGAKKGVQMKKARKTFIRLRSYQKCTARCVLEKSVTCHRESKCVARLPPVEELDVILSECEGTKFYKHSHDSCKCMAHTKGVRKLIGICPFMLNRAVLRRL